MPDAGAVSGHSDQVIAPYSKHVFIHYYRSFQLLDQDLTLAQSVLSRISEASCRDPLNAPELLLSRAGQIRVVYAPFDHIEKRAKLVVVGITPGVTQAVNALQAAFNSRREGHTLEQSLAAAKLTASFSGGAIRSNLVSMLDAIGVARYFDVASTSAMFSPGAKDVHFTSALRYPVFVNGKNYNGSPDMLRTPILKQQIDTYLAEEARALPNAIWLPLGPKAEAAVGHLATHGLLNSKRILKGMPHPSGANAERVAVFLGRKKPEDVSRQTNPRPLLEAYERLKSQMELLEGEAA